MSRDTGRDLITDISVGPETEQLLSSHRQNGIPNTHVRLECAERWSKDEPYLQGSVSSSRPTPQDKSTGLSRNTQVGEPSSNPATVITLPSIIVNAEENDDPPPYAAIPPPYSEIAPPNHVGWSYGLFSSSNSYSMDAPLYRAEMPLASFQASLIPAVTGFYPEGTDSQHASFPMPLTPYRFFKFGCRRNSFVWTETSLPDNGIAEKIENRNSRRYGAIIVAAAVIIFLMGLSLMVHFIMERSWWRR